MGWSSGSDLFADIAEIIAENVPDKDDRGVIYKAIIEAFEDRDCDTLMECFGIDETLDEVLEEIYGPADDDEDEDDDVWPEGGTENFS